jgi:hypothetical protein
VVKCELNIDYSYCLESSIGYISIGENKFCFFTPKFYNKIGHDFCLSLNDLTNKEISSDNLQKIQAEEAAKNANIGNNSNINNNLTSSNKEAPYLNNNFVINNYANNNSHNNNTLGGNFFHTPHSQSYNNILADNSNNTNINSNTGNMSNNQNKSNYINFTNHSHSQSSLSNNTNTNSNLTAIEKFNTKKNYTANEDINAKSKKDKTNNNDYNSIKDKENKEKENKFIKEKEKEIFKHRTQNKETCFYNNKERDSLANKNSKLSIKTPKDISNTNINESSSNRNEKEKDKSQKNLKNNSIKSDLMSTDKKNKKKKKKLNPLKTKKLFIAGAAAFENPNNTSNLNNQINSKINIPSLSSSFLNLNLVNANLVDISKLPKNLGQITEKRKSNNPSDNSTNANFMGKTSHSSFNGNNSETPNLIANNKKKINNNNNNDDSIYKNFNSSITANINIISEDYVKKVNSFSLIKKINDNISRERENSINSSKKDITICSEKDSNKVNNSNSNFDNINDIKTNHDKTFSQDFLLKLNLGEHKGHRNNLSLKIENSEHSLNHFNNISNNSQTKPFSPFGNSVSQIIPNIKNTIPSGNNNKKNINIANIINSVPSTKSQRISLQIEKSKYFDGQSTEFNSNSEVNSNRKNSNKSLLYSKNHEKNENNFININNESNYFCHSNNNYNNISNTPNTIGGMGFMELYSKNKEAYINKNNFFFNNTLSNNLSSEIHERSKSKSINSKIIDPSKIYSTPSQKIYKTLNNNHLLFVKHISKNK